MKGWTGVETKTWFALAVLSDDSDASAEPQQLDSDGIPCSCRLYGNGTDMGVDHRGTGRGGQIPPPQNLERGIVPQILSC